MYQFFILLILVIGLSYLLERFLIIIFGYRIFRLLIAPGIIIHELSHVVIAIIFGAKIKSFKVFKPEGGEVTYSKPIFSFISQPLISIAPIIGCSSAIYLIGILLGFHLDNFHLQFSYNDFFVFLKNLNWNINTYIFLYLVLSFTSAMAPSRQDLINAFYGFIFILVAFIFIHYFFSQSSVMFLKMSFFYIIGLYMVLLSLIMALIFWIAKSGLQKIFIR